MHRLLSIFDPVCMARFVMIRSRLPLPRSSSFLPQYDVSCMLVMNTLLFKGVLAKARIQHLPHGASSVSHCETASTVILPLSWSTIVKLCICICGAGVQIATKQIDEGIAAGLMAAEAGATWLDLNCGCPIYGTHADTHTCICLLSLEPSQYG